MDHLWKKTPGVVHKEERGEVGKGKGFTFPQRPLNICNCPTCACAKTSKTKAGAHCENGAQSPRTGLPDLPGHLLGPGRLLPVGQARPTWLLSATHSWVSRATCWPSGALPASGCPALRAPPSGTCPVTKSDFLTILKAPAKRPAQGGTWQRGDT